VIAIVAVLLGLVLPAIHQARESARRIECSSRLRQVALAILSYEELAQRLPPGWQIEPTRDSAFSWSALLLPYLDQGPLYRQLDFRQSVSGPVHDEPRRHSLVVFLCPSDVSPATFTIFPEREHHVGSLFVTDAGEALCELPVANYMAVFGTGDPDDVPGETGEGAFPAGRGVRLAELVRGSSHVAFVGERTLARVASTWIGVPLAGEDAAARLTGNNLLGPNRPDADEGEFDSRHRQCVQFAFGDGSVRMVSNSIDQAAYQEMARRAVTAP